jgi:hypothetical protein
MTNSVRALTNSSGEIINFGALCEICSFVFNDSGLSNVGKKNNPNITSNHVLLFKNNFINGWVLSPLVHEFDFISLDNTTNFYQLINTHIYLENNMDVMYSREDILSSIIKDLKCPVKKQFVTLGEIVRTVENGKDKESTGLKSEELKLTGLKSSYVILKTTIDNKKGIYITDTHTPYNKMSENIGWVSLFRVRDHEGQLNLQASLEPLLRFHVAVHTFETCDFGEILQQIIEEF